MLSFAPERVQVSGRPLRIPLTDKGMNGLYRRGSAEEGRDETSTQEEGGENA